MTRNLRQSCRTIASTSALAALLVTAAASPAALAAQPSADASTPAPAPTTASAAPPTAATGTLADGAAWRAEVPANWNGKLVLFAHGFRPGPANPAWDTGFTPTASALVARGYAVASSSYATAGWALGTAAQDQLDTLAAFEQRFGKANRVIAVGRSMGGLVTSMMAEIPDSGIDGAVSTCGLVGGGVSLNNYQLDAAYAAAELLLPGQDIRLAGFTTPAESAETIAALKAALQQATASADGRARLALVAALLNTPTELDGVDANNPEALAAAQAKLVLETLPTVIERRHTIVNAAGGDSGWTTGVDYAKVLQSSAQRQLVGHMYATAGLNLNRDLSTLTANADIEPSNQGLRWMLRTSTPTGELQVPLLATHTTVDLLAPVEYQEEYAETVRQAGRNSLFRQAFVNRAGHCNFTVAENIAAIEAMDQRLQTGHWGSIATTANLQHAATSLDLDGANYVEFRPDEFINDRVWTPTR
ncbi:pimeloyl-ACP methyl ester carboxylesterase [Arthrobacter globiformis]|uniref:alpha/beta hydrolase family protein n=1 Tax=Arthrobacter globiformis TaxID=1665 RepID=UPI002780109D|nr:alpha/beta hydrolase [Arthrobacter globiformis]MDQ1058758.1 pimeloyl-ACP methyl ester carboxylesterase [Arthrobacter globiformis]